MSIPGPDLEEDDFKNSSDEIRKKSSTTSIFLVVPCLYACFLVSTVFQEKLYSFRADPSNRNSSGDRFESAALLTLAKSITNIVVSKTIIRTRTNYEVVKPSGASAVTTAVIRCSSTMLSLYSLNFVSYPYLVLVRSVKILPVLVSDFLFERKFPSLKRCFAVLVTTIGMLLFAFPSIVEKENEYSTTRYMGFVFLFMSLCADGGLSFSQRKMVKHREKKPDVFETMFYMSSWQAIFSLLLVLLSLGERGGVSFCMENPKTLQLVLWPSLIESVGQYFIYELVIHHGPFFTALVTTLRKFVTIIISVIIFGHRITLTQWLAMAVVFSGVLMDTMGPRSRK